MHSISHDIAPLRRTLRQQRRKLNRFQRQYASQHIIHKINRCPAILNAKKIGIYLDEFGEVPTRALIRKLIQLKKRIYLPLICHMNKQLHWQHIDLKQLYAHRFSQHRLGMPQAMHSRGVLFSTLDVVIMPLVIADRVGHRVGMGGGYYDRTLATNRQVIRIGLAYDFQVISNKITPQKWDQTLDILCTPKYIYHFKR